jgi:hypothetical protein
MFCTQCGTQVDEGKNFCKNCGARVGRSDATVPSEPAEPAISAAVSQEAEVAAQQPSSHSLQHAPAASAIKEGKSNKAVLIAAGVAVIALAGAGVFFASGIFKAADVPSLPPPPPVQEPMAKAPADNAPLPSFEETKDLPPPGEGSSASGNPPLSPEPPPVAEVAKAAPPDSIRKATPAQEPLPPPVKSQTQRAGQDAGRSNRPTPASRGGASPGVYETLRSTTVYEDPSASAKVLASIPAGVRVNVVNSSGEWLEVHSKRGNPPGFIRRGDATFIESAN